MNDTEDDGHLHLVRVAEHQRIIRPMPSRVQPEQVRPTRSDGLDGAVLSLGPFPTRRPDVERLGKYVVVHQPGVHGKETHEEDDVSSKEERLKDLQIEYKRMSVSLDEITPL
jgi:hypothetical protein